MKLPRMVATRAMPITMPMRQPMASVSTTSTMATAWPKLTRKPFTASSTTSETQCTRCTSMPTGR